MTKWQVTTDAETRIIEADNWGVTDGTFTAFYNYGSRKTQDPFHYIKTADIHEIKRLDDDELPDLSLEDLAASAKSLRLSMQDADTIIRMPPVQP